MRTILLIALIALMSAVGCVDIQRKDEGNVSSLNQHETEVVALTDLAAE